MAVACIGLRLARSIVFGITSTPSDLLEFSLVLCCRVGKISICLYISFRLLGFSRVISVVQATFVIAIGDNRHCHSERII